MKCERVGCDATPEGYGLFDYCASCSKNLCGDHMAAGCCGNVPAESGQDEDERQGDDE